MKIIHTSDLHIDSPLTARLPSEKVRSRKRELLSNFARLVSEAERLNASAIIIAGDMFDSEKISARALGTALDIIERAKRISFFYLTGNHEGGAVMASGRRLPENLYTFGEEWTYYSLGDVNIAGRAVCFPGMFEELTLPKGEKNIVILHGEVRDRSAAPDSIGLGEAKGKNISYLALGHYHSYREYQLGSGVAVYSGTPEGRGFDETGERGFVLLDTDSVGIRHRFIPFAKRRLHIVPIELTGLSRFSEVADKCRGLLLDIPSDDIVRVELTGKYLPDLWKDTEALERLFGDRFYYFEVKDTSKMEIRPEDYKHDKSLKGEFIRLVAGDTGLTEEQRARIISCGISALVGEEIFED